MRASAGAWWSASRTHVKTRNKQLTTAVTGMLITVCGGVILMLLSSGLSVGGAASL
jgi:uncharacterized membrane protein SpoIIM required for sporulation